MSDVNTHDFHRSLGLGKMAESELDAYFGRWYSIEHQALELDKKGVDRVLRRNGGDAKGVPVQYKADFEAAKHKNAFIEVVSVDNVGSPGWAFTCQAEQLIYWVPLLNTPYFRNGVVIAISKLKPHLGEWMGLHDIKPSFNRGYRTWGICVPWAIFEHLATYRFNLSPSDALVSKWQEGKRRRLTIEESA